jgi:hypothetical protein
MDRLPLAPSYRSGEPPTAYASRIAAAYGLEAKEFCGDQGIRRLDLANGTAEALAKLAALGGADPADLARSAFFRTDAYGFEHRGHDVRRDDLTADRLDVCARCLLDDVGRAGAPSPGGACFLRAEWCLDVVETCPIHACALVTLHRQPGFAYRFDFSNVLDAASGRLGEMAEKAEARVPTALQDYVLARLEGIGGQAPFLDNMGLAAAIRTCEMLGAAACFGGTAERDKLDASGLRRARIRGFEIGSRGKEGIEELLKAMTTAHARRRTTVADQAARQAFAALHDYLHVNPRRPNWKGPAFAALRTVLADFIKASFPLKPGDNVLGEIIAERKLHSVTSLAKEIGCGAQRVRKVLLLTGLIGEDQAGLANPNIVFDGAEGARIMRDSVAGLPYRGAASHIGTGRHQVRMFVEAKFFEPIADGALGLRATFAPATLDAFVAALLKIARPVRRKVRHHATMREAARKAMCTQADVAGLILNRRLKWVGSLGPMRDYRSILVDAREVRAMVHGLDSATVSVPEFAERFGIKKQAAQRLVKEGHVECGSVECAGHRATRIPVAEADAFQRRYVSLGELRRVRGLHHTTVKKALEQMGIPPVFDPKKVLAHFYLRGDLRAWSKVDSGPADINGGLRQ